MRNDNLLSSPDEVGWYWFNKSKKDDPAIVYINDDGIATCMQESGDSYILTDLVGNWYPIENP